jgi:hypothetical protein
MAPAVIRLLVQAAVADDAAVVVVVDADVLVLVAPVTVVDVGGGELLLEQAPNSTAASRPLATSPPTVAFACMHSPFVVSRQP